jgi:hypothetical protein
MIEIDHLNYLTSRRHRRQVALALRRLMRSGTRGQATLLRVIHEHANECCAVEAWAITALRIQDSLAADGDRVGWAFHETDGITLVAPAKESRA